METKVMIPIERKHVPMQPCVQIRAQMPCKEMPQFFGEAFANLYEYVYARTDAGVCFARYHDWNEDRVDLEAGVVTGSPLTGTDRIVPGKFGGHEALYSLHIGPYSQMRPVYGAMLEYMKEHELEQAGPPYEVYLNSPQEVAEDQLRTELYWPVR